MYFKGILLPKPHSHNLTTSTPLQNGLWDEYACIQGCKNENVLAQEQLYKHFYGKMMALILRYTNQKEEACTILNNGFLRVFKKINLYGGEGSFEGWIRKIMIHQVADFFRTKKKISYTTVENIENSLEASIAISLKYDYSILVNALQQLNPTCRLVVNLFIIEGYTYTEIKEITGINENTCKWHVASGKKQLASFLNSLKP